MFRRLLKSTQEYLRSVADPLSQAERSLFQFNTPADLELWKVFSDSEYGGRSTAELRLCENAPGIAELAGSYSTELAEGEAAHERLRRSGFCGMSSREGEGCLDLSDYDTLVFRVRGDGRKYLTSIRTENWVVGEGSHDVWQAFLFARPGEWSDVEVPLDRFLLTWRGKLVETRMEMNPRRVLSIGISLAGGAELQPQGPFRLGLRGILARNSRLYMGRPAAAEAWEL